MNRLLWLLALAACEHGSHDTPAVAPPPPPPPPAIVTPITCGDVTCKGNEICTETVRSGGVAPPPGGHSSVAVHYRCATSREPDCTSVDDHHQRCFEKIPSAAPHR